MRVHDTLEHTAQRQPDHVALVSGSRRLTYAQINRRCNRLAAALHELGLRAGQRVMVMLDGTPEAVIAIYAVLKCGAVFIPLNPHIKSAKLAFIARHSGARILICDPTRSPFDSAALAQDSALNAIVCLARSERISDVDDIPLFDWHNLIAAQPADARCPANVVSAADLAAIIYTSGSTGVPKGVVCAHENMVFAMQQISTYLENNADDVIYNALPLSFDYGLYQVLMAFLFGGRVVLAPQFGYPHQMLTMMISEQVTGLPLVPTLAAILLRLSNLAQYDLGDLRYITNTGAHLETTVIRRLRSVLPQVKIYCMYGLTECKRVSYLPPAQLDAKMGSVGIPMPGVEVAILDPKGNALPPGSSGELVVKGPNVMRGYWEDPETTAAVFRPDPADGKPRLFTGDLFKQDPDGYLFFGGRKDDLIKVRGERVSPKEIENAVCAMTAVSEAAVVAAVDPVAGSRVVLFVVPQSGQDLTIGQVMTFCRRNLEPFLVPSAIHITSELPRLASGKVDKHQLQRVHLGSDDRAVV